MVDSQKKFGGAGYRSRYLSHAKRALYHLSYAPVLTYLRWMVLYFEGVVENAVIPFHHIDHKEKRASLQVIDAT